MSRGLFDTYEYCLNDGEELLTISEETFVDIPLFGRKTTLKIKMDDGETLVYTNATVKENSKNIEIFDEEETQLGSLITKKISGWWIEKN